MKLSARVYYRCIISRDGVSSTQPGKHTGSSQRTPNDVKRVGSLSALGVISREAAFGGVKRKCSLLPVLPLSDQDSLETSN